MSQPSTPITALVYADGCAADPIMRALADRLRATGATLAGFIQWDEPRPGRARCDMVLTDLTDGTRIGISQDRGPGARGCRLDVDALLRGLERARDALAAGADVLLLNKFGKTESEGGGFRPLIAEAVMRGIPVVVAVPWRNIEAWRAFAGDLACEVLIDADGTVDVVDHLRPTLMAGRELRETAPRVAAATSSN